MRFIHIADVHLGATPDMNYQWGEKRKTELWDTLARVIEEAERKQVDFLLIAGDLFHRQPLLRECKEVNYLFSKLTKTKVIMIAGNHDYVKQGSQHVKFQWGENVYPLFHKDCENLYFAESNTHIYGFSYYYYEEKEARYDVLKPQQKEGFHILLAHGGDAKHIPIDRYALANAGFDYVALGHIHRPEIIEENQMAYAGALEPIDCLDTGEHGYIYGEITKTDKNIRFVPFAQRSYVPVTIKTNASQTSLSLNEWIGKMIAERGKQQIYRITITGWKDPDVVYEFSRAYEYGNVLEILDHSRPAYNFDKLRSIHQKNIIGRYIERMSGLKQSEVSERALQFGVQALLDEMR